MPRYVARGLDARGNSTHTYLSDMTSAAGRCSAKKCLADKGRRRAQCVMKAIIKIKFWPLIIVGLVWLFGTIVPFANGIVRLLTEAVTEMVGAMFPRVLTTEYTVVATLLGPLAPAAGSDAEIILRAGLVIATITSVGLLFELSWLVACNS